MYFVSHTGSFSLWVNFLFRSRFGEINVWGAVVSMVFSVVLELCSAANDVDASRLTGEKDIDLAQLELGSCFSFDLFFPVDIGVDVCSEPDVIGNEDDR